MKKFLKRFWLLIVGLILLRLALYFAFDLVADIAFWGIAIAVIVYRMWDSGQMR